MNFNKLSLHQKSCRIKFKQLHSIVYYVRHFILIIILIQNHSNHSRAMYPSRPYSQASSSRSSVKPSFQKKFKSRTKGQSSFDENSRLTLSNTKDKAGANMTSPAFYQNQKAFQETEGKQSKATRSRTFSQLTQANFKTHCSECLCDKCNCGKHLCKINFKKPDLSKSSIYKKDYNKKSAAPPKIVFAKDYDKFTGPNLNMKSTQQSSFLGSDYSKVQKARPDDLLKNQGPSQNMTTYRNVFPGHKGLNQYIKPTDRHIRENFPFRSRSTYSDSFNMKKPRRGDYQYIPDQLKTGGQWLGKTTYGNFFDHPNPEYHAKKVTQAQDFYIDPKFAHQYETVYKNDFIPKESNVCPAKTLIDSRNFNIK